MDIDWRDWTQNGHRLSVTDIDSWYTHAQPTLIRALGHVSVSNQLTLTCLPYYVTPGWHAQREVISR